MEETENNMFEGVPAEAPQETASEASDAPTSTERPNWLPEKFKSPEDLVKAYNELGGKIREKSEPPEVYELQLPDGVEGLSEADIKAFKEAGLTNAQAQKLVEYFQESIVPAITQAKIDMEKERLAQAWGIKEINSHEFAQRLVEVKSWAMRNLPEPVVNEMARSAGGVNTLYQLMQAKADLRNIQQGPERRLSKLELQELMNDPRYARRDYDYMEYVRKQFQLAYD